MKKKQYTISIALLSAIILSVSIGCTRDLDELELATYPAVGEVYIDGFSAGLEYAAFGGSNVTAFDVDTEVKYAGTSSMRFSIPDAGDPEGSYAGGVYYTSVPRDLSEFNALTFWIKASKSATINQLGFGNDLGASKYLTELQNLAVNTNWKKVIIPIPDPEQLVAESGMFYYAEGPEEGLGYTFWIDELKFENYGLIAHPRGVIMDGENVSVTSFNGNTAQVNGFGYTINLPTGIDQTVSVAPSWFIFSSSNEISSTVDEVGKVSVLSGGTAKITATIGGEEAEGSLTVTSTGNFDLPDAPTLPDEEVISIFSNAYTNIPIDFYNGYWEPFQTTTSADFTVNEDDILGYIDLNFVGIQLSPPGADASAMNQVHMDLYLNEIPQGLSLKLEIVDFGADGIEGGDNDTKVVKVINTSGFTAREWASVDLDLSGFSSKANMGQLIFVADPALPSLYVDNVYFFEGEDLGPTTPTTAAPTPTEDAANVISIYSDQYTPIADVNYNPGWDQNTIYSEVPVDGNNVMRYGGLDYQGLAFETNAQNLTGMDFLHVDFWTANSTSLNVYLISPGPVEASQSLTVPTNGNWTSVDIPMSAFAAVDLTDVFQMKFDGNGDIYIDNLYFYKNAK